AAQFFECVGVHTAIPSPFHSGEVAKKCGLLPQLFSGLASATRTLYNNTCKTSPDPTAPLYLTAELENSDLVLRTVNHRYSISVHRACAHRPRRRAPAGSASSDHRPQSSARGFAAKARRSPPTAYRTERSGRVAR